MKLTKIKIKGLEFTAEIDRETLPKEIADRLDPKGEAGTLQARGSIEVDVDDPIDQIAHCYATDLTIFSPDGEISIDITPDHPALSLDSLDGQLDAAMDWGGYWEDHYGSAIDQAYDDYMDRLSEGD